MMLKNLHIDAILTGTTILSLNGPKNNDNKRVTVYSLNFKSWNHMTRCSSVLYIGYTFLGGHDRSYPTAEDAVSIFLALLQGCCYLFDVKSPQKAYNY